MAQVGAYTVHVAVDKPVHAGPRPSYVFDRYGFASAICSFLLQSHSNRSPFVTAVSTGHLTDDGSS